MSPITVTNLQFLEFVVIEAFSLQFLTVYAFSYVFYWQVRRNVYRRTLNLVSAAPLPLRRRRISSGHGLSLLSFWRPRSI